MDPELRDAIYAAFFVAVFFGGYWLGLHHDGWPAERKARREKQFADFMKEHRAKHDAR